MDRNNTNLTKAAKAKRKAMKTPKNKGANSKHTYVLGDEHVATGDLVGKIRSLEKATGVSIDIDTTVRLFEEFQVRPQSNFMGKIRDKYDDRYMDVFENVFLLTVIYARSRDIAVLSSATLLFAKSYVDKSMVKTIVDFIDSCCLGVKVLRAVNEHAQPDVAFTPCDSKPDGNETVVMSDAGSVTAGLEDGVGWYIANDDPEPQAFVFEDIIGNFKSLRHSALVRQLNNLISLIITLGFVDPISFNIKGVTIFSNKGIASLESSENFFDYCLELFEYFFKSFRSLFGGEHFDFLSDELTKIDQNIIHMQAYISSIAMGDYVERTGKTVDSFQNMVMQTITTLRYLIAGSNSKPHTVFLNGKMAIATKIMVQFEQCCPLEGLRVAPFSMSLFGKSSVGKTSVATMLTLAVLKGNGFEHADTNLCTLQSNDKFYSTYRADTTAVFLDDLANTKAEKALVNPSDMIVSLVNNVTYYAPKAVAEEKGKIKVQPKVVCVTTNVKELEASTWSNEPLSVVRRLNLHITVTVKPEYARNGKLAPDKFSDLQRAFFRKRGLLNVWDLTLERVVPKQAALSGGSEGYAFELLYGPRGKTWELLEAIPFILGLSKRHFSTQNELITNMRSLGPKLPINENGEYIDDSDSDDEEEIEVTSAHVDPVPARERMKKLFQPTNSILDKLFKKKKQEILAMVDDPPALGEDKQMVCQVGDRTILVPVLPTIDENGKEEMFMDALPGPQSHLRKFIRGKAISFAFRYTKERWYGIFKMGLDKFWMHFFNTGASLAMLPLVHRKVIEEADHYLDVIPFTNFEKEFYPQFLAYCPRNKFWVFEGFVFQFVLWSFLMFSFRFFMFFLGGPLGLAEFGAMMVLVSLFVYCIKVLLTRCLVWDIFNSLYNAELSIIISDGSRERMVRYGQCVLIGGVSASAGLLFIAGVRKLLLYNKLTCQGNLTPVTSTDVEKRDAEVNVWVKKALAFGTSKVTATYTGEQLLNRVSKNCLHAIQIDDNRGSNVSVLMISSNFGMCPYHFFCKEANVHKGLIEGSTVNGTKRKGVVTLKFVRSHHQHSFFKSDIYLDEIVRIGSHDMCVFRVFSGGTFSDVTPFFMTGGLYTGPILAAHMRSDGSVRNLSGGTRGEECHYSPHLLARRVPVRGGVVRYDDVTENGMCTCVLVSNSKNPSVIGLHIAGFNNSPEGRYISLYGHEISNALDKIAKQDGNLVPHSATEFDSVRFGIDLMFSKEIAAKSPVHYIAEETYKIMGSIGTSSSYFSEIRDTTICRSVEAHFGIQNQWGKPKFGPERWKPWYNTLAVLAEANVNFPPALLKRAKDDYLKPILQKTILFSDRMRPLTEQETINGIHGCRFIDAFNFQSGAGIPLKGPKKELFEGDPGYFEFKDPALIREETQKMRCCYMRGERYYHVFKACLKDEPTKKNKDKVRVFQASGLTLQMEWRRLGLPLLRLLSIFPLMSECAVGINPFSDEWGQLHNHVGFDGHSEEMVFAGDYSKWDLRLSPDLIAMAFEVLIAMAQSIPSYTSADIMCMRGLATDTIYYMTHYNGTLIEMNGGVPSGHNLTAHVNSICNSLLIRMCYFQSGGPTNFRALVHLITYGDDFMAGVREQNKFINHIIFRDFCATFGLVVTMPDKVSTATEYMSLWSCDFLKRRSVLCPYNGNIYGALDITSVHKSLMNRGKLKVSVHEHIYAVVCMAQREVSYHSQEVYEDFMHNLRLVCAEHGIITHTLHMSHYDFYLYREDIDDGDIIPPEPYYSEDGYPIAIEAFSEDGSHISVRSALSGSGSYYNKCDVVDEDQTLGNIYTTANPTPIREVVSTPELESEFEHVSKSEEEPHPQSELFGNEQGNVAPAPVMETGTGVTMDGRASVSHNMDREEVELLGLRQDPSRSLGMYTTRPEVVLRGVINNDLDPNLSIYPLRTLLNRPNMRDKFRGYAFLNAKLNLKVVIDSSPQISGAVMFALHPWRTVDNGLGAMSNSVEAVPSIIQKSQLPHIVADFGLQQGGEISMPIITPANGLDLTAFDGITESMTLYINLITRVYKPATVAAWPRFAVYAYLSEVTLVGTTLSSELPGPQSNEYSRKPKDIIKTADMSFKDSVKMASKAVLGKASDLGVDAAFQLIGLASPNDPQGAVPMVPRASTNMACSNAPVNIDNLAADVKNEVTSDMTTLGYWESDPMSLDNILTRWSLCARFLIPTTTLDLPMIVFPVYPTGVHRETLNTQANFHPTPLAVAALGFSKWRGSIRYRFYAVGSVFLRGKIRIAHDVVGITNAGFRHQQDASSISRLNNVVWDLSVNRCIEIVVPWTSNLPFKNVPLLGRSFEMFPLGDGGFVVDGANGGLLLTPMSTLSDGEATDVPILASVRGEPGMAFGDPRPVLANYTFAGANNGTSGVPMPQSNLREDPANLSTIPEDEGQISVTMPETMVGSIMHELAAMRLNGIALVSTHDAAYFDNPPVGIERNEAGDMYVAFDTPETRTFMTQYSLWLLAVLRGETQGDPTPQSYVVDKNMNTSVMSGDTDGSCLVVNIAGLDDQLEDNDAMIDACLGEKFFSIRQLIKRYTMNWTRHIPFSGTGFSLYRITVPDRPIMKGWQGSASLNLDPAGLRTTYARDSFLSFFSVCFLGYRGSFRHKYEFQGPNTLQYQFSVVRSRGNFEEARINVSSTLTNNSASTILFMPDFRSGGLIGSNTVNNVVEFSTPFQSRSKFVWAQDRTPQILKSSTEGGYDLSSHSVFVHNVEGGTRPVRINKFIAAGDDFTFMFFLYAPIMVIDSPPPFPQ